MIRAESVSGTRRVPDDIRAVDDRAKISGDRACRSGVPARAMFAENSAADVSPHVRLHVHDGQHGTWSRSRGGDGINHCASIRERRIGAPALPFGLLTLLTALSACGLFCLGTVKTPLQAFLPATVLGAGKASSGPTMLGVTQSGSPRRGGARELRSPFVM